MIINAGEHEDTKEHLHTAGNAKHNHYRKQYTDSSKSLNGHTIGSRNSTSSNLSHITKISMLS